MRQLSDMPLWLGNVIDARDPRRIIDIGIQVLMDLAGNEPVAQLPRELVYCRFPLMDGRGNPIWLLSLAVTTLSRLIEERIPTLVYCSAGMSRTPAIVAMSLSRLGPMPLGAALALVTMNAPADVSPALWHELQSL